jgi:hypothetical protein
VPGVLVAAQQHDAEHGREHRAVGIKDRLGVAF